MRKLFWVLAGIMVLAALGNIIGGTDTPVAASVDPGGGQAMVWADIPAAPRFDATLFVSASSLNLREAPNTSGRVLTKGTATLIFLLLPPSGGGRVGVLRCEARAPT